MKQFKYNLMQRAYLRETFYNVPVGSKITIMGRYSDNDDKCFYHVIQGYISFKSEDEPLIRDVPEGIISSRPPYETLYAIKTELYYRYRHRENGNDIYTIKYVLGNLNTARAEFYCEVDRCITLTMNKLQYGKVSLYVPVIKEDGYVLDIAEENIDQKFFFERG